MKKVLVLFAVLWAVTATAAFPDKPVKIITSMPIGSGPDNLMRKMAERLTEKWGVPVLVENKAGGSGAVMFNAYAEEKADGYTVAIADFGAFVGYPVLYNKPEVLADIQPLAGTFLTSFVLATSPSVKDFTDLKTIYKNNPVFASHANGSGMHLQGLELSSFWNIKGNHAPYKELGVSLVDVSNGLVPFTFTTIASSRHFEAGGKLKYIAIASPTRNPAYPNVPTLYELTGKSVNLYHSWNIVYIKKAVPIDIKAKISKDVAEVMKTPEMQENIKLIGYRPLPGTPADLEKFVNSEIVNFKKATDKYKISIE